jgi:AcrB/AcrD/AcrF family
VQRPLATVVVGGLVSSTLLTLFVLPTVYGLVRRRRQRENSSGHAPLRGSDRQGLPLRAAPR